MHEGSANHVGQGAAQNNATGIAQNFADQFFFANWNTQESKMIITTYICEVVRVKDIILTIYLTFS